MRASPGGGLPLSRVPLHFIFWGLLTGYREPLFGGNP